VFVKVLLLSVAVVSVALLREVRYDVVLLLSFVISELQFLCTYVSVPPLAKFCISLWCSPDACEVGCRAYVVTIMRDINTRVFLLLEYRQ
jgi:hypothetical protein